MTSNRWGMSREWLVFTVIVVDLIGFGIVIPILPFMSPALGGDEFDVALVIALYSVCAGVAGSYWGALSDRIGRKKVLMICLTGGAISYILLGFANELWLVYVARAMAGVMAGNLPVASALMADLSRPERRAKAMGLVGTAFGLGLILGPLLGGLLAGDGQSFAAAGFFAAAMSLLSVVLAAFLLPPDGPLRSNAVAAPVTTSSLQFIRHTGSELLLVQYVLHTFAVSAAIYLSPLWLAALLNWGPREIGILFGVVGLAMIIIQGALLNWLTTRFGLINLLGVGAAIFAASLIIAPLTVGEYPRAIVVFMAFTGATCVLPVLNTIASTSVPATECGRMMGLTALAASVGRVGGPLVIGAVLTIAGYTLAWLLMALPVAVVLIWAMTRDGRYQRSIYSPALDSELADDL